MLAVKVAERKVAAALSGAARKPALPAQDRAHRDEAEQPRLPWDFATIPLFSSDRAAAPPFSVLQAKLAIRPVDDPLEREADRVAEKVMRMPEPAPVSQAGPLQVSRKCAECEEEEDKHKLQKKSADGTQPQTVPPIVHEVLRSPGQPLDPKTRAFMEPRFGYDFSTVRIHRDDRAAHSAREMNARAYAVGTHVVFAADHYSPSATAGRHLLAHELAHVVQQRGAAPVAIQRDIDDGVVADEDMGDPDLDTEEADGEGGGASDTDESSLGPLPDYLAGGAKGGVTGVKRTNVCAAGDCPQGKQKKVVHDDCASSGPADQSNFITDLDVALKAGKLTVTWSNGNVETWPCTGHPGVTPTGPDVIGDKCSKSHTNLKKDGMAWFTGFKSQGLRIGFHDSQPVGPGFVSHACIRVCCDNAKIINSNTWSGKTKISVT